MAIIRLTHVRTRCVYNIDTNGTWHNFQAEDIITDTITFRSWYQQRVEVKGTFPHGSMIDFAGVVVGQSLFDSWGTDNHPIGLILLERPACAGRPGWPFKVYDRVVISGSTMTTINGTKGEVVVLDPSAEGTALVQLDQAPNERLPSIRDYYRFPWFPDKYKVENNKLVWVLWDNLLLANAPAAPASENSRQTAEPLPPACHAILREARIRLEKGELPVFNPLKFSVPNGAPVDFGEVGTAKNKRECLRLLGVAIFHALTGESEWNDAKYDAEPEASYRRLIPANKAGDLVKFFLFDDTDDTNTIKEIIGSAGDIETFSFFDDTDDTDTLKEILEHPEEMPPEITVDVVADTDKTEPDHKPDFSANDVYGQVLARLVAAGLDEALAVKILHNPTLAERMIAFARSGTP